VTTASISLERASQVLRPPEDGLEYLRHNRAAELLTAPGDITVDGPHIAALKPSTAAIRVDASGCAVLPGLVDCHTHLPFAGWREGEYAQKIAGAGYEEIARAGGGIRSSARSFAQASDEQVLDQARDAAQEMLIHGTTAFECKTGYGLSIEAETRAAGLIAALHPQVRQTVTGTALLAHAVPDGWDADAWMDAIAEALPAILQKASDAPITALDIYVESVAFSNEHLRRMGELASEHHLDLRAHVEQFNANGSVPVAVQAGARSVDHLACIGADDVALLAHVETAAVLLPGAEFLGEERLAPARALADTGAICALATDFNPGTSPLLSLPVVIGLAVRRYRWTVREALLACTLNAAWVMRLEDRLGSIEVGKRADLLVLDGPLERIPYRFGHNPVQIVIAGGEIVYVRPGSEWRITR
jgi:imidazolonepropionase